MSTDVRPHFRAAAAKASATADAIHDYLRFAVAPPLAVLLLGEARVALVETANAVGNLLTPDELEAADTAPAAAPARKPSGDHRHKFGPDNICTVGDCRKVKSANGRKPAIATVGEMLTGPPADTRTRPLPLGDAAADKFSDGGQGSSMVRR